MTPRPRVVAGLGVAVAAALGLSVFLGIGEAFDPGRASGTKFTSQEFAFPLSVVVPDGWAAYERREGVAVSTLPNGGAIEERCVIFRTSGGAPEVEVFAGFEDGEPISEPWPNDLAAWLMQHPNFESVNRRGATVAGSAATILEARSIYDPPAWLAGASLRIILVGSLLEGIDVAMQPGEMIWRFVVFTDRALAIACGASPDQFSDASFAAITQSLTLDDEPSGS